MVPKSGYRFSEKIMLKQEAKAKCRLNLTPFRFSHTSRKPTEKTRVPAILNGLRLAFADDKCPEIDYEELSGPVDREAIAAKGRTATG